MMNDTLIEKYINSLIDNGCLWHDSLNYFLATNRVYENDVINFMIDINTRIKNEDILYKNCCNQIKKEYKFF